MSSEQQQDEPAVGGSTRYQLSKDGMTNLAARSGIHRCSPDVAPTVNEILSEVDKQIEAIAYRRARENGRVTFTGEDVDFAASIVLAMPTVVTGN
jgi:histone H3/H4